MVLLIVVTRTLDRITITGHAQYNGGNDIVCSAVSALTQAFIVACEDIHIDVALEVLSGNVILDITKKYYIRDFLTMFWLGICKSAEFYPNNVKIIVI